LRQKEKKGGVGDEKRFGTQYSTHLGGKSKTNWVILKDLQQESPLTRSRKKAEERA